MLWLGSPFCPDTRWWASTLERPNRQHCHPHGNKNKKSPLAPSSRIAVVSPSILEPSLHARIAAACSTATVLPPPAFLSPHCHSPLTAEFYRPTRRGPQWLLDCSSVALFTTPSRLLAAILPLHCTRAPFTGYRSSPPGWPWLPAAPCVCFNCVSEVIFKCFICMLRMLQWLHTYVASICFKHFSCLRRMFHAFHLYV